MAQTASPRPGGVGAGTPRVGEQHAGEKRSCERREEPDDDAAPESVRHEHGEVPEGDSDHRPPIRSTPPLPLAMFVQCHAGEPLSATPGHEWG
jgi:hypothetical protein